MLRKWIRNIILDAINTYLFELVRMEPDKQYLIAVPDDTTARELRDAFETSLDKENSPRIVILAARDFKVLEIGRNSRK